MVGPEEGLRLLINEFIDCRVLLGQLKETVDKGLIKLVLPLKICFFYLLFKEVVALLTA